MIALYNERTEAYSRDGMLRQWKSGLELKSKAEEDYMKNGERSEENNRYGIKEYKLISPGYASPDSSRSSLQLQPSVTAQEAVRGLYN